MSAYSLPSGTKLGDGYEILGVLGSGGFGITCKAWDVQFHRFVAIKEYFPFDLAVRSSGSKNVVPRDAGTKGDFAKGTIQFVEEGRTLAKFSDERIVRAKNFVKVNDTVYMVMEYQEDCSLSQFLAEQEGPLTEKKKKNLERQSHKSQICDKYYDPATQNVLSIDFMVFKVVHRRLPSLV